MPYLGEPGIKKHNQSWKMESLILEHSAENVRQHKQTIKVLIANKFSWPESTVKTAAKALSLSPSMTLLEWTSSKHMRLKPTSSRTMYNISEISDSHSIPAKRGNDIGLSQVETQSKFDLIMWCYTVWQQFHSLMLVFSSKHCCAWISVLNTELLMIHQTLIE